VQPLREGREKLMVFCIQIGNGPLIPVNGYKKAREKARFLLSKARPGTIPWLITAKDRSEIAGGWGVKRRLSVTDPRTDAVQTP
jgi:hypothetical protein